MRGIPGLTGRPGAPAAVSVLLVALAGACGGGAAPPPAADGAGPTDAVSGYVADCVPLGSARGRLVALEPTRERIPIPGGELAVTIVGDGPTTVVLLHQINGGSCGWEYFLSRAGSDPRFRFVAPDLCGNGTSRCGDSPPDRLDQVRAVLDRVRSDRPDDRTVIVGASMGGAQAVRAAALGWPIAAAVSLSGPDGWFDGAPISADIRRARVPLLLVYDPVDDPGTSVVAAREARRTPARVRYLEVHGGHGWANLTTGEEAELTDAAMTILDFAAAGG